MVMLGLKNTLYQYHSLLLEAYASFWSPVESPAAVASEVGGVWVPDSVLLAASPPTSMHTERVP